MIKVSTILENNCDIFDVVTYTDGKIFVSFRNLIKIWVENIDSGQINEILVHPNFLISDLMFIIDREFPEGGKIIPTFVGKPLLNHMDNTLFELGISENSRVLISIGSIIGGASKPPCHPDHERKYGGGNGLINFIRKLYFE